VVFIHGGAWRAGLAKNYAFPAEMLVAAGAHYAAIDFNNVIETGGDLLAMAAQVKRAVAWTWMNAERLEINPRQLFVCGTSSGAHFGGVLAATDWNKDFGLPRDAVKGYTLVSGMYDLRGPRLSKRSQYVKFTDEAEEALSPQRHLERIAAPITLVYGSLETPEFQRQSQDFAAALRKADKPVELVRAEGYNHFEIAATLGDPEGPAGKALLRQMQLT
jgi:arylformamidase